MPTKWWFVIAGWDEERGGGNTLVETEFAYETGWPELADPNLAVVLVNEVISEINERLHEGVEAGVDHDVSILPFLGACAVCRGIVDASHLYGPDSDICDRCMAAMGIQLRPPPDAHG